MKGSTWANKKIIFVKDVENISFKLFNEELLSFSLEKSQNKLACTLIINTKLRFIFYNRKNRRNNISTFFC